MNYKFKILIGFLFVYWIIPFANIFADYSSLFFSNIPNSPKVGDSFTISLNVRTDEQSINAVSGKVYFASDILEVVSVSKDNSIVNIWTKDKEVSKGQIVFEGVILNPGYIGNSGNIIDITFSAKKKGLVKVGLSEGSVLANDGLGTNILSSLKSISFNIEDNNNLNYLPVNCVENKSEATDIIIPSITQYTRHVLPGENIIIRGNGEPDAFTRIVFRDTSVKSIGEIIVYYLQTKKERPNEVIVKNTSKGNFIYVSPYNLLAGAYEVVPLLVGQDKDLEKSGSGINLMVSHSQIINIIIIIINILVLLIPVMILSVIVYFIPWYSLLRMRILKKKISLEEEKIELSEKELKKEDFKHLEQ